MNQSMPIQFLRFHFAPWGPVPYAELEIRTNETNLFRFILIFIVSVIAPSMLSYSRYEKQFFSSLSGIVMSDEQVNWTESLRRLCSLFARRSAILAFGLFMFKAWTWLKAVHEVHGPLFANQAVWVRGYTSPLSGRCAEKSFSSVDKHKLLLWEIDHCGKMEKVQGFYRMPYTPAVTSKDLSQHRCLPPSKGVQFSAHVRVDDDVYKNGSVNDYHHPVQHLRNGCRWRNFSCDALESVVTAGHETFIVLSNPRKRIVLSFESEHRPGNTAVREVVFRFLRGDSVVNLTHAALTAHLCESDSGCYVSRTIIWKEQAKYLALNYVQIAALFVLEVILYHIGVLKTGTVEESNQMSKYMMDELQDLIEI